MQATPEIPWQNRKGFPWKQILLLLLLPLIPAAGTALLHPGAPSWSEDTPAEGEVTLAIIQSWGESPLWVDARSREEYEAAHIPGAVLLNEDNWEDLFFEFLDHWIMADEPPVVVYCGSRGCRASHLVAKRLREEIGSPEVHVLRGGWETWTEASP